MRRAALILLACALPAAAARPTIILVSIDTLRADRVGAYGYKRATTPRLDAFAKDAILFENVVSAAPWTLPSHMSMFTGRYPPGHGLSSYPRDFSLVKNLRILSAVWEAEGWRGAWARFARQAKWHPRRFRRGVPTLAELLRGRGYRTAAFAATDSLRGSYGFSRGFDVYDNAAFRGGEEQVRLALDWLADRRGEQPSFLFLHLYDAHGDFGRDRADPQRFGRRLMYGGPEPFRSMFDDGRRGRYRGEIRELFALYRHGALKPVDVRLLNALYDGGVRYADGIFGSFLDGLRAQGLYENAVVLVTSDHGEALMVEHPEIHHDCVLYRELVHVPFVLKLPGGPRGARVPGLARTVDYLPTALEAAGLLEDSPAGDGVSLLPRVRGAGAPAPEAYSESHCMDFAPPAMALETADGWKALFRPYTNALELYDLRRDPKESRDVAAERPETAGRLQERLLRYGGILEP